MPYLIDGHNLIGQLSDIRLDDPNDEAQLVQKLNGFAARTRQKYVVVFDQGLPGGASRMSNRSVCVIFASHKSDADQVIMDRIRKEHNPREWIVVSSDNLVLETARRYHMATLRSAQFAELLERLPLPPEPGLDEAPDVALSEEEVDEWLDLFESD